MRGALLSTLAGLGSLAWANLNAVFDKPARLPASHKRKKHSRRNEVPGSKLRRKAAKKKLGITTCRGY